MFTYPVSNQTTQPPAHTLTHARVLHERSPPTPFFPCVLALPVTWAAFAQGNHTCSKSHRVKGAAVGWCMWNVSPVRLPHPWVTCVRLRLWFVGVVLEMNFDGSTHHTYSHPYKHTPTHPHTHTPTHAHTHTCIHSHALTHTYIHTHSRHTRLSLARARVCGVWTGLCDLIRCQLPQHLRVSLRVAACARRAPSHRGEL